MPETASKLQHSDGDLNKKHFNAAGKPIDLRRESYKYASEVWKRLVRNVGERDARSMMHQVMGEKQAGRPRTDRDVALLCFIYGYLRHFGLSQTDGQIAKRIFDSSPLYLEFESGAVAVANNEFTEAYLSSADDPVVTRRPLDMRLSAIKKRVERIRRYAIGEKFLPNEYAPRAYCRDS
jgi:hypothetical protein